MVERQTATNAVFLPLDAIPRYGVLYHDSTALPEISYGFRLRAINDVGEATSRTFAAPIADSDGDGVPDYLESVLGTNSSSGDSDGDGLPDAWELKYGLNPLNDSGRDGPTGDFDHDGVSNLTEYEQGANPADGASGDNSAIRLQVYRPN